MSGRVRRSPIGAAVAHLVCWTVLAVLFCGMSSSVGFASPTPRIKTERVHKEAKYYQVDVKYPAIVAPRNAADLKFNEGWRRRTQERVARFVREVPQEPPSQGVTKSSLDVTYEVCFQGADLIGVSTTGGEFTGGAHPSPIVETQLFDLRRGRDVPFQDLFRAGSPYLATVSRICIENLGRRKDLNSDIDWIRRGASPSLANFKLYHPARKSLVVVFPPYQVAPYSSGIVEVEIPFASLERVIAPSGPLGRLR